MAHLVKLALLSFALAASSAHAVVYCNSVGMPKGCVGAARAGTPTNRGGPVDRVSRC